MIIFVFSREMKTLKFDFIISKHISWQNVGNIVFIFDENNKGVMMLDEITTLFWSYLESGYLIDDIVSRMMQEYEVDYSKVRTDIIEFINLLKDNDIILAN